MSRLFTKFAIQKKNEDVEERYIYIGYYQATTTNMYELNFSKVDSEGSYFFDDEFCEGCGNEMGDEVCCDFAILFTEKEVQEKIDYYHEKEDYLVSVEWLIDGPKEQGNC